MSLGIAFKGPEGIVLAADSRVTLTIKSTDNNGNIILQPSTFDNAQKLLMVPGIKNIGTVTYGIGTIQGIAPRTAYSYLPEFEDYLFNSLKDNETPTVLKFATKLGEYFLKEWKGNKMSMDIPDNMVFLVAGYDGNDVHGKIYQVNIPHKPKPKQWHSGSNDFGPVWGGQLGFTNRLIHGFDPGILQILQKRFNLSEKDGKDLGQLLRQNLEVKIPYPFLSLQDCVDLSILLIDTTKKLQSFYAGIRGVGGSIDVATITRRGGYKEVQVKKVCGET